MIRNYLGALGLCLAPVVSSAAPITYTCEFAAVTTVRANGWLPPEIVFRIDEATNTATVDSARIRTLKKGPLPVKLRKKANGRYAMRWTLKNLSSRSTRKVEGLTLQDFNTTTTVGYFAELNPKTLQLVMRASPGRATETYNGSGSCRAAR